MGPVAGQEAASSVLGIVGSCRAPAPAPITWRDCWGLYRFVRRKSSGALEKNFLYSPSVWSCMVYCGINILEVPQCFKKRKCTVHVYGIAELPVHVHISWDWVKKEFICQVFLAFYIYGFFFQWLGEDDLPKPQNQNSFYVFVFND